MMQTETEPSRKKHDLLFEQLMGFDVDIVSLLCKLCWLEVFIILLEFARCSCV